MVNTTLLGEKILRSSILKSYEILMEGVILKVNLISLEMNVFDVILGLDFDGLLHQEDCV